MDKSSQAVVIWSCSFAVFCTLIIVLCRFFVLSPYRVDSGGMYPTQHRGETIWGFRLAYRHPEDIHRGDILMYKVEVEHKKSVYGKRVIGLPGDRVRTSGGSVFVNGVLLAQHPLRDDGDFKVVSETVDLITYEVALQINSRFPPPQVDVLVPENAFFVLGDNRYNSLDSRYTGFVLWSDIVAQVL